MAKGSFAGFEPTQWTVVLAAREDSQKSREALAALCRAYWPPIYGFLRRQGIPPADAEDLTQGFLAHVLDGDFFQRPDPERGRFRTYLIGALRQFVGHERVRAGAQKRGGTVRFVEFDSAEAEQDYAAQSEDTHDPRETYDRAWAMALLARARQRLEAEQVKAGRRRQYELLRPFLNAAPARGDYESIALALAMSRASVAVAAHRLTQRFGELVKLEVAATLTNPDDVDAELRHLLAALQS